MKSSIACGDPSVNREVKSLLHTCNANWKIINTTATAPDCSFGEHTPIVDCTTRGILLNNGSVSII
jgi:hypothetical protein